MPFIRPGTDNSNFGQFALRFPSNSSASNNTDPYAVIEFVNPHLDGMRMWGANNTDGITVIRKLKTIAQAGYFAGFWYTRGDGQFNSPTLLPYWGFHPYPDPPPSATNHCYEIAINGLDIVNASGQDWNDAGSNKIAVPHGTTHLEAIRITRNNANSKTLRFYTNLPNVDNPNCVEYTVTVAGYGETDLSESPKITIGDSPWWAVFQHERFSCDLDTIKIFNAVLSEADVVSESEDFSRIVTSAGQASIWWGRNGFDSSHIINGGSIQSHYGINRSFTIVNPSSDSAHKLSLVSRL